MYVALSQQNISTLQSRNNSADNWKNIFLLDQNTISTTIDRITGCTFNAGSGRILIGELSNNVIVNGTLIPSQLTNSNFYDNCHISKGCAIVNTIIISNAVIGESCCLIGCRRISGPSIGDTTNYGNKEIFVVGAETGGRGITLSYDTPFHSICRDLYLRCLSTTTLETHSTRSTSLGNCSDAEKSIYNISLPNSSTIIGHGSIISNSSIIECYLGPNCLVADSSIDHSTLLSTTSATTIVRNNVSASFCLLQPGCVIEDNCYLDHVHMSEASSVGINARVNQAILGPDSSIAGGECHRSLVGPFIGFHHHSLLIACVWPFGRGNLGYGAKVGANHTGRVNDQECWPGEGCFFGLGCSMKFPLNLIGSPYSIIAPDTVLSPQMIRFPFSLLCPLTAPLASSAVCVDTNWKHLNLPVDACIIKPAWTIYGNPYMIDRSGTKFTSRRRSRMSDTGFPVLRPSIIDQIVEARNRISVVLKLLSANPHLSTNSIQSKNIYLSELNLEGLGRCVVSIDDVRRAEVAYSQLIKRYALHGFIYILWVITQEPNKITRDSILVIVSRSCITGYQCTVNSVSVLESMINNAIEDFKYYDPDCFELKAPLTNSSSLLTGSGPEFLLRGCETHSMNTHQFRLLRQEFPNVDFFKLLTAVKSRVDEVKATQYPNERGSHVQECECTSVNLYTCNDSTEVEMKEIESLLEEASQIESAYANAVKYSREKDGERGVQIIPGYSSSNKASCDVMLDSIVSNALKKSYELNQFIQNLFKLQAT